MALGCVYRSSDEVLGTSVFMAKGTALPRLGTARHAGSCVSSPRVNLTFLEAMKEACTEQAGHNKQETFLR